MPEPRPLFKDESFLRHFWHPVATLDEFESANASGNGPMPVELLEQKVVLARLGGKIVAMKDQCVHRCAKLSGGKVKGDQLQCPYHGWMFNAEGKCTHMPACPTQKISSRAKVDNYDCEIKYGLVWVRLDSSYGVTEIPYFSVADNPNMRIVVQEPYWWEASAPRRWENFTDFSHFAFVHPGTLFDPNNAEPPIVPMDRVNGQFRFIYDTPAGMDVPDEAPIGSFTYHCSMPFAINLAVQKYVGNTLHVLFNVSCPVSSKRTKNFLIFARDASIGDPDYPHIAFNNLVFAEDQPVIESQWPEEIMEDEISVVTDKVSMQYRKWMKELELASEQGKDAFKKALYNSVIESDRTYPDMMVAAE
ncbi:aromatic ring-hydroxylating dioxygenase subunit alpha [Methylobacterium oryzae]|uniref:Rieske domain-containing protein n=1 Tax=Methylobacterium oryzae TaxID=334852 RepID=A0ABU7TTX8_9HYPH